MDGADEIIKEFLVESYESLDQLDGDLLALEEAPEDRERLANIFRTVHTIKGTSGFLAFPNLERVAHVGENLLVPLRDGELRLNHSIADGLLGMVDAIRAILGQIESGGEEGEGNYEDLIAELEALRDPQAGLASESLVVSEETISVDSIVSTETLEQSDELIESAESDAVDDAQTSSALGIDAQHAIAEVVEPIDLSEKHSARPVPPAKAGADGADKKRERTCSLADSTVRIDVEILDALMNLVGELVLARNQILQYTESIDDATLIAASQRLNLITTELQGGVMKTRMQPIRNAWSKLPRVVRDLSAACGKRVEVQMEGEDTELDKTILEAIKDPLTHIVRNSVDHGIETAEVRVANGKSATGTLWLRAFHEGGQVNIEISDDGGGINSERVRHKAVENGLVTEEQAEAMSERELTNMILLPGFSTAQKVTNVSGRGVGMDVVKTNIERIGGSLEINSVAGEGTTLRIKIPLTLAIVPALIVLAGGDRYAIPQVSLLELVRLDESRAETEIEFIHDTPVYRLRGQLLPLVYLDEQLEIAEPDRVRDGTVNIVVLRAEDQHFGLVVDSVTDTQEIVVKPLGRQFQGIPAYAGATIMGDGSVALILDVLRLAQKGNALADRHERRIDRTTDWDKSGVDSDVESLLVVDFGDGSHVAVRLSTVARLEEFSEVDIERSGDVEVVQYRGSIMPLLRWGSGGYRDPEQGSKRHPVVVYSSGDRNVGVVVGQIVDIVDQVVSVSDEAVLQDRYVVHGRVTELIDLEEIVQSAFPGLLDHSET